VREVFPGGKVNRIVSLKQGTGKPASSSTLSPSSAGPAGATR
jgi:hypothetical protein